jgi:methylated-DNA-[protein]-cysteine S-methyltransferase
MTHTHTINSPLGHLRLEAQGDFLTRLTIGTREDVAVVHKTPTLPVLQTAATQLEEYFAGVRQSFHIPVLWQGTPFQERVWTALQSIPFGTSVGYQELGEKAGVGLAARAVGGAVGANPLPIIVPCHRVLSKEKTITGYSGGEGIPTKVMLLELERISYR